MEEITSIDEIISHISVPIAFAAALTSLFIGAIWYHEKVFGRIWMNALGKPIVEPSGGRMALVFGITYIMAVMLAYFLQIFIEFSHWHPDHGGGPGTMQSSHTFLHGAYHGFFFSLFIVTPVIVVKALFEQFNWKYILVHVGYWMLTIMVMSGIVDAW
jgi:hypothetical protein